MKRLGFLAVIVGASMMLTCPPFEEGRAQDSSQCGPSAAGRIPEFIDWMARPDNCNPPTRTGVEAGQTREAMRYKTDCLANANPMSPTVPRTNKSATHCVAWAVREAVNGLRSGDANLRNKAKYRAVAWLALAEGHDPCARRTINDHKKVAYDYLVNNYVAAWRDEDPESHPGIKQGEAFKVNASYNITQNECELNDEISLIDVPPGLGVILCDHHTGNPGRGKGCREFGPGTHKVGSLNDNISYVRVFRK